MFNGDWGIAERSKLARGTALLTSLNLRLYVGYSQIMEAPSSPTRGSEAQAPSTPTRGSVPAPFASPPRFTESQMLLALDAPKSPKSPAATPSKTDNLGKMKMPGAMKVIVGLLCPRTAVVSPLGCNSPYIYLLTPNRLALLCHRSKRPVNRCHSKRDFTTCMLYKASFSFGLDGSQKNNVAGVLL